MYIYFTHARAYVKLYTNLSGVNLINLIRIRVKIKAEVYVKSKL